MKRILLVLVVLATASMALAAPPRTQGRSSRAVLDMVLPEMKFDNVALNDTFDFLRDVSGANIHVNWKALEEAGVNKDTNVNVRLRSVTLRKVLNLVLGDASGGDTLAYYVDQGVIEITTKELADKKMYTKVYPVEDLIMEIPDFDEAPGFTLNSNNNGNANGTNNGNTSNIFDENNDDDEGEEQTRSRQERADALVQLIMDIIRPEIWKENGGPASIRFWNGSLIVTAPRSVHEAIGGAMD